MSGDYPPLRANTRLSGHTLIAEGRPFTAEGQLYGAQWRNGHAKCSCGALSEALPSQGKRQKWHREHKESIRAEQA